MKLHLKLRQGKPETAADPCDHRKRILAPTFPLIAEAENPRLMQIGLELRDGDYCGVLP